MDGSTTGKSERKLNLVATPFVTEGGNLEEARGRGLASSFSDAVPWKECALGKN